VTLSIITFKIRAKCPYAEDAEYADSFILYLVMLIVFVLNVIMQNLIVLNVVGGRGVL
jgi:hypothetical protein